MALKRNSPDAMRDRAQRLLKDRTLNDALDDIERGIVKELGRAVIAPETEGDVLELVRKLQAQKAIRAMLMKRVQMGELREADFKPRAVAKG